MKTLKNVICDVNVSVKIKKSNILHDLSHGVDLAMCKQTKRPSVIIYQSNIASKPATGTPQSYTLTKNRHLTSLKAVELGSLVHVRVLSNL